MKALLFEITLEQPVFVARPAAGEENSCKSYEFIPGATLRGALIGMYLAKYPKKDISHDPECRKWFFSGENCFLNAYPVSPGSRARMLPRPLSWRMEKDQRGDNTYRVYDFAVEENPELKVPISPAAEFVHYTGNAGVEVINVRRMLVPHNASITRQVKRADESFVFLYDVLAAGQTFAAVIVGQDVFKLRNELELADGQLLFLGGSRSANYGRVRLTNFREVHDWKEYETPGPALEGKILVTLLSDAILVDQNGQPAANPDDLFGCKHLRSYQKTRLVGGFNRKWGLPLPQAVALQAGSVFVYDARDVHPEKLQKLVENGIGERCSEGYGRIAVDWNSEKEPLAATLSYINRSGSKVQLSSNSAKVLQEMAKRRLRFNLDGRILDALERIEITDPPRNAQLSQIRQAAKEAATSKNLKPLIDRMVQMKRVAKRQFEKAIVKDGTTDEASLDDWLTNGLSSDFAANFWRLLYTSIPSIGGQKVDPKSTEYHEIQVEYIARFVEGLMRKTIRTNQAAQAEEDEE